ncbi:hypothetical protein [Calidifontibacter terrae]
MRHILMALVVVAGLTAAAGVTGAVRQERLSPRTTRVGALACAVGLVTMVLSDFPYSGNRFWAAHSVLAAVVSSLLLVGVVFLAYETQERKQQEKLALSLSGAGLGGLVDHLVDVEVALALATAADPPERLAPDHWTSWRHSGKPLRWIRSHPDLVETERDPRLQPTSSTDEPPSWQADLVDQSIRRILAGMRDWSTLIGRSDEGVAVLIILSELRVDLMTLAAVGGSEPTINSLRWRCRVFAMCFERWSGAVAPRPELITDTRGLSGSAPQMVTANGALGRRLSATVSALRTRSSREPANLG